MRDLRFFAPRGAESGGSLAPVGSVGIACWLNGERRYFTTEDWKAKYKSSALGVYVNTTNTHLIIHRQYARGNWSNSTLCPNVFTTTQSGTAKTDYNGVYNTQCVIEAYNDGVLSSIPLFESIKSIQFIDGSESYLPAMGELWDIMQYRSEVLDYLSLLDVGWGTINFYSSTQYNAGSVWTAYQKDQIRFLNKGGNYYGLAVTQLNINN